MAIEIVKKTFSVPLEDLAEWKQNPRLIRNHDYYRLKRLLKRLGQFKPLLAVKNSEIPDGKKDDSLPDDCFIIIGGNKRLHAMRELGFKTIDIIHIRCKTYEEMLEISLADNDRAGMYDEDLLAELLFPYSGSIPFEDYAVDLSRPIGVENVILAVSPDGEEADPDLKNAAALEKKWKTTEGQTWKTGDSFLIIGDAKDPEVKRAAFALLEPEIVITDPPYDMDPEEVSKIVDLYGNRMIAILGGPQAYAMAKFGWDWRFDLIWNHRAPSSVKAYSRPVYHHRNIPYLTKGDAKYGWNRPRRNFGSIIKCDHEYMKAGSFNAKSAEIFLKILSGFKDKLWVDPFVGAGSTIIACEFMKKKIVGIEINPQIGAVALDRLERSGIPLYLMAIRLSEVYK